MRRSLNRLENYRPTTKASDAGMIAILLFAIAFVIYAMSRT